MKYLHIYYVFHPTALKSSYESFNIELIIGWGEEGEARKWRRKLLIWEEEQVRDSCELLSNIVLQPNIHDKWF